MNPTPIIDMFSSTGEFARAVSAGLVEPTQGETEYVLSTMHYFFVWPVESTIHVQADDYLLLKKGS